MKLIYLYVENCMKKLAKKELNFSSRYIIERSSNFEIFKEDGILNFEVRKKEFYDDILYGKNIEVYGIVGNNGVGKSTVLDYIRRLHYDYEAFEKECEWLVLYGRIMENFIYINVEITKNFPYIYMILYRRREFYLKVKKI